MKLLTKGTAGFINIAFILFSLWSYNGFGTTVLGSISNIGTQAEWDSWIDSLHPVFRAMVTDPSKIGEIVEENSVDLNSIRSPKTGMLSLEFVLRAGDYHPYPVSDPFITIFGDNLYQSPLVQKSGFVIKKLLKAGANINQQKALDVAIRFSKAKTVELLLKHGAVIGPTDLHTAVRQGTQRGVAIVKLLLKHGADPSIRNRYNQIPYMVALDEYLRVPYQRPHTVAKLDLLRERHAPSFHEIQDGLPALEIVAKERQETDRRDFSILSLLFNTGLRGTIRYVNNGTREIDINNQFLKTVIENDLKRAINELRAKRGAADKTVQVARNLLSEIRGKNFQTPSLFATACQKVFAGG